MRSMIDLNISVPVANWDSKDQSVIGRFPQKDSINLKIQEKKIEAMKIIDRLYEEDLIRNKSVAQIKDLVLKRMYPDSIENFVLCTERALADTLWLRVEITSCLVM